MTTSAPATPPGHAIDPDPPRGAARRSSTFVRLLFATTTFVAAALVFLVQPMVAKQLLPVFGGTPGVWAASVSFFQVALLVGYAIAHVSLLVFGVRRQPIIQIGLAVLALAFLPFAVGTDATPPASLPHALWIALLLAASVGVPYLAVTTASPVLQRWYAALGQDDSGEPWFLYVASNAGSLVGLLAFPVLLEPRLDTDGQEWTWVIGFGVYVACILACAITVRRRASTDSGEAAEHRFVRVKTLRALRWIAVAALPVALMLGVTTFLATDVASAPFIWAIPLALYLVSFIITFGRRWRVSPRIAGYLAAASVLLVVLVEIERFEVSELARAGIHIGAAFFAAVLAHSVLYEDRPQAEQLTTFYLLMSVGGAIGGTFVSLVAPIAFNDVYEYPLLLALVLFLRPAPGWSPRSGTWRALLLVAELAAAGIIAIALAGAATKDPVLEARFVADGWLLVTLLVPVVLIVRRAGIALLLAVLLALVSFAEPETRLFRDRNFFGTTRVIEENGIRHIKHGTTLHGGQLIDPARRREGTTYYTKEGPLGDIVGELQRDGDFDEVSIVGLGSGAILAHAHAGQRFTFYEIDPVVIRAAKDPDLFTWISDANVDVRIVEGDARKELETEERQYDLLAMDAFSSDAIPVHLMTVEAMQLDLERLAPDGVLAMHVSSRHLDLLPVISANAARLGLVARTRVDRPSERRAARGATASRWVVLVEDADRLGAIADDPHWKPLPDPDDERAWTDDFSNVAQTIKWLPGWMGWL
ncbi:MAG: hypothetical protein JWL76_1167 [Thermoleophilia bacterium]|nr:hypothetical protein [Thermoleophilia bacterium]